MSESDAGSPVAGWQPLLFTKATAASSSTSKPAGRWEQPLLHQAPFLRVVNGNGSVRTGEGPGADDCSSVRNGEEGDGARRELKKLSLVSIVGANTDLLGTELI